MSDTLTAYARHLKARNLRPATITAYLSWLRRLNDWAECGLLALDLEDLEEWIAEHDWAPASHVKAVQALRGFYQWAVDTNRITADPSASLQTSRIPRGKPNPCPEDVYATALDKASGQDYWRIRLAGETGLRRSELAAVHSRDVRRLATGPVLRVLGKGGVTRVVPLPEDLATWLELQHGYVFVGSDGCRWHADSVGRWYARRLGVNPHRLRHRYATLAYQTSQDIAAVKELLGHASISTTQIYVAVGGDEMAVAAAGSWQPRARLHVVE